MHEYVTRAVVLAKETRNDADARYAFFTERFGKIVAKAKSSRKIVSKLAGHLEPGTLAAVRIIEQHGTQVVDALKTTRVTIPLAELAALNNLLPEWEPDMALWHEVSATAAAAQNSDTAAPLATFSWARALALLGWDPRGATCANCGRSTGTSRFANGSTAAFHIPRQEFFCASCAAASKIRRSELILI